MQKILVSDEQREVRFANKQMKHASAGKSHPITHGMVEFEATLR